MRNVARLFFFMLMVVMLSPVLAQAQEPMQQAAQPLGQPGQPLGEMGDTNLYSPMGQRQGADGPYIQNFDNGSINWATGRVSAKGIGVAPPNAVSPGQARAMAKRAATEIARRNLLEIIQGVNIDSRTTVRNYMVSDDTVVSEVRGYLKYSRISDPAYMSDGTIEITAEVDLRGDFAQAILPKTLPFRQSVTMPEQEPAPAPQPSPELAPSAVPAPRSPAAQPAPAQPAPQPAIPERNLAELAPGAPRNAAQAAYTGLVIDARGLGARPAMSPRILSQTGEEVYGSASVSRQYAIEQGIAGYARGLDAATINPRVSGNPLVVKAVDVSGESGTDLVVSEAQAERLKALAGSDFMEKCRVMIVLD